MKRVASLIATQVAGGLVLFVVLAAIVAFAPSVRDALWDILTSDVPVWLVAVVAILIGCVATVGMRRAQASKPRHVTSGVEEVPYGGVIWPVTRSLGAGSYRVDAPLCPADKTQLGLLLGVDDDSPPLPAARLDIWRELPSDKLNFECLECHARYDLRSGDYSMSWLLDIVEQKALAEERRRREARSR